MYQNKKVLITGGLGFIGSNLALSLVKKGAKITILDNFQTDHGANLFNVKSIINKVRINICDLRDQAALNQLVREQDIIVNLAAQTSHSQSLKEPLLDLDINCRGNLFLLEACRQFNPKAKIIFLGTRAFYGQPKKNPVSEKNTIQPKDIYSINRYTAEAYHLLYQKLYGIKVVSLRLSNCYGPRGQMKNPFYSVINWFIRLALENQAITIFGNGQQQRDYLYIDDLINIILIIGQREDLFTGQIFNIGSGQKLSLINLVKRILRLSKSNSKINFVPWPDINLKIETGDFITDINKIHQATGWRPRVGLTQGLNETIHYYQKYKKYYY